MNLKLTTKQKRVHHYLNSFSLALSRINSALTCIEHLDTIRNSITASIQSLGISSEYKDKMADNLAQIDDITKRLHEVIAALEEQYVIIDTFITEIQKEDHRAGGVIRLYYMDGLSIREISQKLEKDYSKKTIYAIIKRGLNVAYNLLYESEKLDF